MELEAAKAIPSICIFFGRFHEQRACDRDALWIGTNLRMLSTLGPEVLSIRVQSGAYVRQVPVAEEEAETPRENGCCKRHLRPT